jgi:hypothetical protein
VEAGLFFSPIRSDGWPVRQTPPSSFETAARKRGFLRMTIRIVSLDRLLFVLVAGINRGAPRSFCRSIPWGDKPMSRHITAALLLATAIGGIANLLAAANQAFAAVPGERAQAAVGAPVRLFEGREAGPNELYRFCVIDAGRIRRCPGQ